MFRYLVWFCWLSSSSSSLCRVRFSLPCSAVVLLLLLGCVLSLSKLQNKVRESVCICLYFSSPFPSHKLQSPLLVCLSPHHRQFIHSFPSTVRSFLSTGVDESLLYFFIVSWSTEIVE
ncbi:uncharacterized protein LOC129317179 [Prosopis cineraria]|uniref:uncharacterized protein LOC129317179 n=1 Tax=Prosopis cineraria TaxID=364024 RepID=UPI00240F3E03|nr:uncharacterized protein LOC129317179 [Prosopis cineraria]